MTFFPIANYQLPITNSPVDLSALLDPYITDLTAAQLSQVSTYLDLLLRWNAKMNLTSIRNPEQIVSRHFGESFFLAAHLFPSLQEHPFAITSGPEQSPKAVRDLLLKTEVTSRLPGPSQLPSCETPPELIDIGSGAGFPAIPLKIYRPNVTIKLVEAHQRKAVFLREVLRALELDAEVKNVRAETLPPASADLVTLRAVEKFDSILPIAARLVRRPKTMEASRPRPAGAGLDGSQTLPSIGNLGFVNDQTKERVSGPFPPLERAGARISSTEPSGSLNSQPPEVAVHRARSTVHGLALLIGSAQIARTREILPNWRFHPEIPIPRSQNRVIQLLEPN